MPSGRPESRYTVVRRLARGGMAEVYLAVLRGAHGFEKQTIVKRMREDLADQEEYRRMFIDEARLMASLSHANIVGVLDFGESDDGIFLALEYVDGLDLAKLLKRAGTLSPALAIYLGSCVLHGLAYVHGRTGADGKPLHVVHRDVSPSNIFLGVNGDVKLGDFGVAKNSRASVQTVPGTIKGKISYMSPEQAMAEVVDGRSDLFSVGIVLYEALTGRRPFSGETDLELLERIVKGPAPDARAAAPGLPATLVAFLQRALATARDDRFQSAEEMARALLACGVGTPAGPSEVARLVAAQLRPEDSSPPPDPFAAALGLPQPISPGNRHADTTAPSGRPPKPDGAGSGRTDTAPALRRGGTESLVVAPRSPWPAAVLGLLALAGVAAGVLSWRSGQTEAPAIEAPKPGPVVAAQGVDAGTSAQVPVPPVEEHAAATAVAGVDAGSAVPKGPHPAAAPRGRATIDVNSTPWAKVYVDNKFVGDTAVTGLSVPAGRHRLALHNPAAGKSFETTIELAAGEHRTFPVDLERGVLTEAN